MNATFKRRGLLLVAAVLFLCVTAFAQEESGGLYTWTDKDGVVHVTDSLDKVPKEYRTKIQQTEQGTPRGNVEIESQAPATSPSTVQGSGNDAALKAQWQSRMRNAKRQLKSAEDRYQELLRRKNDLQAQWGSSGAALPPQQVLDEMKQLDNEMSSAKSEIDSARDQIDNVIPDEARRAGVPPGWLREVE